MKKLLYILILSLFLTGCFSYRDVNRVVFVTSIGIDLDEDNKPILYAEAFASMRPTKEISGGAETRIVFNCKGETIFEAIRNLNRTSALKLNYTQNKAIIFSEKAAKYGLDNFLDVLIRDQEFLMRQYIYVTKIDMEELMKIKLNEESYIGVFLADLALNRPVRTKESLMRIDEFIIERNLGSKVNALNIIEKMDDALTSRIAINKLVIMKDDKMVNSLNDDETFFYNIAKNNIRTGYIRVSNPENPSEVMTLEILKLNTKIAPVYNGSIMEVTISTKTKTSVAETKKTFRLSDEKQKKELEKIAENNLKKGIMDLYEEYRDMDIDIFNLQKHINIKYPNANIEDIFNDIILKIEADVFIEGSSDTINFY